jgi:hypothetical protein
LVGHTYQASHDINLHTMSGSCVPPIFAISLHFAQFSSCTPSQYLAGRRVFAPFDQEFPNPGSMEKACVGHGFSWSNTRVNPTRVGGGQLSLPGSPGTNLHTMSRVLGKPPKARQPLFLTDQPTKPTNQEELKYSHNTAWWHRCPTNNMLKE